MAEVFLCQSGQLTAASRRELKRAGIVVVEVGDLAKCQFIRAGEIVSGTDMLWAAMDALRRDYGYGNEGRKQREQFTLNIFQLVEQAHAVDRRRAGGDADPS
jgi:hypothetical protein